MFSSGRRCKAEFEVRVEAAESLPSGLKGKSFYVALQRGQEYSGHSPSVVMKSSEMSIGHPFKFVSYLAWAEKAKGTFLPKELKFKIVTKRKRFLEAKVAEAKFDLSKLVVVGGGVKREQEKQRVKCYGKNDVCIVLVVTFKVKVLKIDGKVLKKVPKEPSRNGQKSSDRVDPHAEIQNVDRELWKDRQFIRVNDESYCLETDLDMSEQQVGSLDDPSSESILSLQMSSGEKSTEGEESELERSVLRLGREKRGELADVDDTEELSSAEHNHEKGNHDSVNDRGDSANGEAGLGQPQGRGYSDEGASEGAEGYLDESASQNAVNDRTAKLSLSSDMTSEVNDKRNLRELCGSDEMVQKLKQEDAKRRRFSVDLRSLDTESIDEYGQVRTSSFGAEDPREGVNVKKKKKGALRRLGFHFRSKEKSKSLKSDHSSERPVFDKSTRRSVSTNRDQMGESEHLLKTKENTAVKSKANSNGLCLSDDRVGRNRSYSKEGEWTEKSCESDSTESDTRHSNHGLTSRLRGDRGTKDESKKNLREDLENVAKENERLKPELESAKSNALMQKIALDRTTFDDGHLGYKASGNVLDKLRYKPKLMRSSSFRELGDLIASRKKGQDGRGVQEKLSYYKDEEDILSENWDGAGTRLTSDKVPVSSEISDSCILYDSPSSSHRMLRKLSDVQVQLAVCEQLNVQREKIESLIYNSPWTYTQKGRNESAEKFADYIQDLEVIGFRNQYTRNSRKLFIDVLSALYGQSIRHEENLEVLIGTFCWIITLLLHLVEKAEALGRLEPWIKNINQRGIVPRFSNIEEANQEMGRGAWNVSEVFNRSVEDLTPSESFLAMSNQLCSYYYTLIFSSLIRLIQVETVCQVFFSQCDHEDYQLKSSSNRAGNATGTHESRDAARAVISMLSPFFQYVEKHHLLDCLKVQLLGQAFYFIDAELVNFFFRHPDYCSAKTGISVKMAVSYLNQWMSIQRYSRAWTRYLENQFGPVLDVANVLTIDKKFFNTGEFEHVFPRLSPAQVHQLPLRFHRDEFSAEIISSKTLETLGVTAYESVSKSVYLDGTFLQALEDEDELAESDLFTN